VVGRTPAAPRASGRRRCVTVGCPRPRRLRLSITRAHRDVRRGHFVRFGTLCAWPHPPQRSISSLAGASQREIDEFLERIVEIGDAPWFGIDIALEETETTETQQ
jgi:hypothetical protein